MPLVVHILHAWAWYGLTFFKLQWKSAFDAPNSCKYITNKVVYFHINSVIKARINFGTIVYFGLVSFAHLLVSSFVHFSLLGNSCLAVVILPSVASLTMLVPCLVLQRNCISSQYPIDYTDLAYSHLQYAWVTRCTQYYFLSIDLFRSVISVFGYSTLNILMGIKLPSQPLSILYLHSSVLWLIFVFSLAVITDCMLWKLKCFHLTASNSAVDPSISSAS